MEEDKENNRAFNIELDTDVEMCSPILPPKRMRHSETILGEENKDLGSSLSLHLLEDEQHEGWSRPSSAERVNPFEKYCLQNYKHQVFSPGVFQNVSTASTPCSTTKEFNGWNIHEMANLFPKNLESSPSSHTNPYPVGEEEEERAQQDINEFFSEGPIAPTPDDVPKKRNFLYRSPAVGNGRKDVAESWTNTMLSLPPNLPPALEQALEQYCNVESCSETVDCDSPSNNSFEEGVVVGFSLHRERAFLMAARRRLDLSSCESTPPNTGRQVRVEEGDPFSQNHEIASPMSTQCDEDDCDTGIGSGSGSQYPRYQFTPTSDERRPIMRTPDITPIRDDMVNRSSSSSGCSRRRSRKYSPY